MPVTVTQSQLTTTSQAKALIVVLGGTGVGKSSFINTLAGDKILRVGDTLERETQGPSLVQLHHPKSSDTIAFVDTPGIDSDRPANELLIYLNRWLNSNHEGHVHFGGFLILEESHAKRSPEALSLLVGHHTLLVLTKPGYGPNGNKELYNSTTCTTYDPPIQEKAWTIVDKILEQSTGAVSVRLPTEKVFKDILQEVKRHRRSDHPPSVWLRLFLAFFCIGCLVKDVE